MDLFIHPTTVIDPGAAIGEGTRIWHFCHLMPLSRVGAGCNIGQNVFIDNGVLVGDRVKIQNNVSLYNGVTLGDDVFVGPSAVFTNVINPRSSVERRSEFKATVVGRGATIGANATIICGVTIGAFAFIGAGAVVTKDVLAHQVVMGNPGEAAGWMSEGGYKLNFPPDGRAWCMEESCGYILVGNTVSKLLNDTTL